MLDGIGTGGRDPVENVERQAYEAFEVSRSHCKTCRSYHAVYPFMRLAGRKRGVDADRDVLEPMLARFIDQGARRILLAGSGDPGLLGLVLSAAGARSIAVTVVDLCPTPLATCRSLASCRGITIETQAACLSKMAVRDDHDLVLAHSVLSFIPSAHHAAVGERFRQALAPGGHLVMATSVSAKKPPVDAAALCTDVLAGLATGGIELPTSEPEFRRLLIEYSAFQRDRSSPWTTIGELTGYLTAHGLEMSDLISKDRITGYTADGMCVDRGSPGVIVIARRMC